MEGGAAIALCDAPAGRGGSWGEDGRVIASLDGIVLSTLPDAGGTPIPLTELTQGDGQHRWPQLLPGSRAVLFTVRSRTGSDEDANIEVLTIRDRRRKTLQRGGTFGRYLADTNGGGYLVYVKHGTLMAEAFDVDRLEVRGTPTPMLEEVGYNNVNGSAQIDASQSGTLVFRTGGAVGALVALQWLDASGNTQPLSAKPARYTEPRVSPDGQLLAVSVLGDSGSRDIWVYDWQRDAMARLTFGGGIYSVPVWSPDGSHIVFAGGTGEMFWTRADGAGQPEVFLQTPAYEEYPAFSPDGRWIAYRTNESGRNEIQVRAFPDRGGKWSISSNGGAVPVWSPNGRELFYRTDDQRITVVSYTAKGGVFVTDEPRLWWEKRLAEVGNRNLDIAPDGKRFVVMTPVDAPEEQKTQNHVIFLQNFSDEVQRRVGTAK